VAKRYGKLPSEVMLQGNTFDLYVSDVAARYQNFLYDKSKGKNLPSSAPAKELSQEEMFDMIKRTKERSGANTKG
jgi:hypothetical protein